MPDPEILARLERIERLLETVANVVQIHNDLVPVLESIGEAMTAMSHQVDVLTEALLPESEGASLTLDGELEGGERDPGTPLDVEREAEDVGTL